MAQPLWPSFTPTYHNKQYPAIDPRQPHLDCSDKVVLITGAGTGIGQAIAVAFAQAHAKGIVLLGRTESTLQDTANKIQTASDGKTDSLIVIANITSEEQVRAAFEKVKAHYNAAPDILVNNAGGLQGFGFIADIDLTSFWQTFELNVLRPMTVTQAFMCSVAASDRPDERRVIINLTSGAAHLPYTPQAVAYATSKIANAKIFEYAHFEHPDWLVVNMQPGVVATELARKAGRVGTDSPDLPGGFAVWLARDPRAEAVNWKFVWANWDVKEVLEREEEIKGRGLLSLELKGWAEDLSPEDLVAIATSVHRDADKK